MYPKVYYENIHAKRRMCEHFYLALAVMLRIRFPDTSPMESHILQPPSFLLLSRLVPIKIYCGREFYVINNNYINTRYVVIINRNRSRVDHKYKTGNDLS